jgi:hypothetical protein
VYAVPPAVFVLALALSGGYRLENRSLRGTATGFLLGFFGLSALTYFFKDYAFSRGIVLVTTAIAATTGLSVRFLWLLWRASFGPGVFRRVAFLTREAAAPEIRSAVRRLFLGRPVTLVGAIAPTFSDLDALPDAHLGTVEAIAKLARVHRLTDVVVLDRNLGYSEVMQAMRLCGSAAVRFHIALGGVEAPAVRFVDGADQTAVVVRRLRSRTLKRLRDAASAAVLLVLRPLVYLAGRSRTAAAAELLDVMAGVRPLVGPGGLTTSTEPVFTVAELCDEEPLSPRESAEIEEYYRANSSFLLDCEIVLSVIRQRNAPAARAILDRPGVVGTSVN